MNETPWSLKYELIKGRTFFLGGLWELQIAGRTGTLKAISRANEV